MSISIRDYIRWGSEEASEPTTTLVLTSPERRFVDIRVLKAKDNDEAQSQDTIGADLLPFTRLDWAFAGTSESEVRLTAAKSSAQEASGHVHSKWHHWISSRTRNVDGIVDEGDMFPQPDGRTLETGSMVNPASGKVEAYEEMWADPEPTGAGEEGKVCKVLILRDEAHEARGMVVRVGQFCQGVLRIGEAFALERWGWREHGGWRREVRMGDLWLPCGVPCDGERVKLGGEVKYGDHVWKCVELAEL
ncbi:uncharacterized protein LTR77_005851 [Saxophila tyrrhenica]|uniref:Protein HRI1 n=1 Tax=Saxophila tyrrhenica TaxID=1690608 RepID=A0AAV9PA34_9PEZI|nr:hypothetical protein LTR77_005851 [Saxophila tyrrhenica]